MTVFSTETYTGLTLSTLLNHIYWELGQVVGLSVSYDRFPRWYVIDKLNDRLNKFVFHSQCLKKIAIIQTKAGYRNYRLPENCMEGGIIGYPKYFQDATTYQNLEIKDTQWLDDHYEGWLSEPSTDIPLYVYTGESYGNLQMLGVYPPPLADGDSYILTPDTGISIGADLPGISSNVIGVATGGSGTTLQDSTIDFTVLGLVAGMGVLNVTDGSQGYILTVAAHTITFAATLTGGTANTFTLGDTYNILAGEYGVVTSWSDDGDYVIFSCEVGKIANITIPAGNIRVDFIPYPLPFPQTGNDNQIPEIPKLYHMDYAAGVVADLLSTFQETTREFQRAGFYEAKFTNAVALARTQKEQRPFKDKPHSLKPMPKWAWRRGG